MLKKYSSVVFFIFGFIGLLAVRGFESALFYDPLREYFKGNFSQLDLPLIEIGPLILHLFFRYFCNMLFSVLILYALFKDFNLLKFVAFVYFVFFVILIICLLALLLVIEPTNDLLLFYVRRFLVQPILLILFIPAFYFQRKTTE